MYFYIKNRIHKPGAGVKPKIRPGQRAAVERSECSQALRCQSDPLIRNLTEEAYHRIKGFILASEIYPKQKVVIEDVAKQLGISRTPIREAINRLVKEGYIYHILNRGFFVKEITLAEVAELYGAREALEPYLAEEAARRAASSDVTELAKLLARYGDYVERQPRRQRRLLDVEFHLRIAEIAGNAYLREILEVILERIVFKQGIASGNLDWGKDAWRQHRCILDALRSNDPKRAKREALHHVRRSRELAMLRMREQDAYFKALRSSSARMLRIK